MLHRVRQAWAGDHENNYQGPVEVDETNVGGRRRNMSSVSKGTSNRPSVLMRRPNLIKADASSGSVERSRLGEGPVC